jgi:hypothetical protein
MSDLHPSIIALVSLAANIAANHPKQGLCQVDRLKGYGVAKEQIDAVIEIARHIRDEASRADGRQASTRPLCRSHAAGEAEAQGRPVCQHRRG